ncbi:glycosyltransferase family 2 protein, partial [Candidatus Parcubacteria bacterium]
MDEQLSICIPTYNRPSLIKRALDGALNQVDFKGEIVVCDNSENSETENVIASYSSTRIRYLRHGKNIGIAGNWNALLHMAKGKYVKFLNDDDEFLPECISTIKKALKALGKEVGVITCCAEYVDDFGNIIKRDRPKNAWGKVNYFVPPKYISLLWCYDAIPLRTPTHMVYNREAALSLGGFREDLDYTRDVQLALEIASEYGA